MYYYYTGQFFLKSATSMQTLYHGTIFILWIPMIVIQDGFLSGIYLVSFTQKFI
jgi:hypothetical protein